MAQPRGGGASALEHVSHVLACLVHRHSFFEDEEPPPRCVRHHDAPAGRMLSIVNCVGRPRELSLSCARLTPARNPLPSSTGSGRAPCPRM